MLWSKIKDSSICSDEDVATQAELDEIEDGVELESPAHIVIIDLPMYLSVL